LNTVNVASTSEVCSHNIGVIEGRKLKITNLRWPPVAIGSKVIGGGEANTQMKHHKPIFLFEKILL
jgi:hypothetical protein